MIPAAIPHPTRAPSARLASIRLREIAAIIRPLMKSARVGREREQASDHRDAISYGCRGLSCIRQAGCGVCSAQWRAAGCERLPIHLTFFQETIRFDARGGMRERSD